MTPTFLNQTQVLTIQSHQVHKYGGAEGLRDPRLLESALAQPGASFGGEMLHADVFEQAAAYLFHLSGNHVFIDGNKRVALHTALVFLMLNGISITADPDAIYDLTMSVAAGQSDKATIAAFLRGHAVPH